MNTPTHHFCICVARHNAFIRQSSIKMLSEHGYSCTGDNTSELLNNLRLQKPDFVFLDATTDGLALCRNIGSTPQLATKCVLFFGYDSRYLLEGLFTDASGYLYEDASEDEMLLCLQRLRSGERYINPVMIHRLENSQVATYQKTIKLLTLREGEIFRYLGYNYQTKQIADLLSVSPKTVESYLEQIKQKLNVCSTRTLRHQAILAVTNNDLRDENSKKVG